MGMNKVPTLLVGLGGIGCSIVNTVNSLLSEEDKQYVGCIGMDTNQDDLKKLDIKYVQTSDERLVKEFMQEHPEYRRWFPINKFTANRGMLAGAGQIRAISRLAAIAAEQAGRFTVLDEEIKRIRNHNAAHDNTSFNVFLCGSITGGTGAGLFLMIPFYIKKHLKEEAGLTNVRIRGMFMSADITKNVQPSAINRDAVMVNAYACLKELNAFYLNQVLDDSENHLQLEYYEKADREARVDRMRERDEYLLVDDEDMDVDFDEQQKEDDLQALANTGDQIPYDAFYLIEGSDNQGSIGTASIDSVKKHIAKIIFTMLFTPVKVEANGVEDNFVLQDMEGGGMNRYSSAGMCSLVYPCEQQKEYAKLRWIKDLVQEEWMLLDKSFEQEVKDAQDRQKSDPSVVIPAIGKAYPRLFEYQVSGKQGTRLGHLKSDAFIETEGALGNSIKRSMQLKKKIDAEVDRLIASEAIMTQKEECKMNMKKTLEIDAAEAEIARVEDELFTLKKMVLNVVNSNRSSIANEVFPVGEDSLRMNMESSISIYGLLANVHPIVARYLIYDLMNLLDKESKMLDSEVADIDLESLDEEDYDPKTEGVQTAGDAISLLRDKRIPVIRSGKGALKSIVAKKSQNASEQADTFIEYGKKSLRLRTYEMLLERFRMMAKYYEEFFSNIQERVKINDERISQLEKTYAGSQPFGEMTVCGSPEAFRTIYREFSTKLEFALPKEAKVAIFEGVFRITSGALKDRGTRMTESQKRSRDEVNTKALKKLFDTGVADTLETLVYTKSRGIIDMNIKQAVSKELQMKTGMREEDDPVEFEKARIAYERQLVEGVLRQASPMFAVTGEKEITETIYMAINPEAAEESAGQPSAATTKEHLVPEKNEATDNKPVKVLMDEGFSPYEIMCMKAKHKYMIDNLVKYRKDSEFARVYSTRINNLGKEPTVEGVDAFKTVVTPHLNRYWHEEGFIPELGVEENTRSKKEVLKAFVYAMGMDKFARLEDRDNDTGRIYWYFIHGGNGYKVRKEGKAIGNGYVDLLDSLYFNRKYKRVILGAAERMKKQIKGYQDADEMLNGIKDTWFIQDLAQSVKVEGDEDDENILDIFAGMYDKMDHREGSGWYKLFEGLELCLRDYLNYMLDKNAVQVDRAYTDCLEEIGRYSILGRKKVKGMALSNGEERSLERLNYMLMQVPSYAARHGQGKSDSQSKKITKVDLDDDLYLDDDLDFQD